jgi:hypothetical protein
MLTTVEYSQKFTPLILFYSCRRAVSGEAGDVLIPPWDLGHHLGVICLQGREDADQRSTITRILNVVRLHSSVCAHKSTHPYYCLHLLQMRRWLQ